jgi:lysophospholipase L1-like esterase
MHTNIFVFGDSVALGCYDPAGGWVRNLGDFVGVKYFEGNETEYYTYNLSIHSQTTADILIRLENEIPPRLFRGWEHDDAVVFAVGLNDSAYVHSKKENWVDFGEFKMNIKKLIDGAGKFSKKIVFVGLYPIDESKMNPMPYDTDKSYRNDDVKKYDQALREIAKGNGAGYIPIYEKFMAAGNKNLLYDGAHPNYAGHQLIFETVKDYLLDKKII